MVNFGQNNNNKITTKHKYIIKLKIYIYIYIYWREAYGNNFILGEILLPRVCKV